MDSTRALHPKSFLSRCLSTFTIRCTASGRRQPEVGKQLVRAKEVERRLIIARKQFNSDKKDQKKAQQADNDFVVAAGALKDLKASKFDLKPLSLPQLQSLVRALSGGKAKGKKACADAR